MLLGLFVHVCCVSLQTAISFVNTSSVLCSWQDDGRADR